MPVNPAEPGDPPTGWVVCSGDVVSANELVGAETPGRSRRRRCEEMTRNANRATKITRAIEEP
jgi:hypothetical protein